MIDHDRSRFEEIVVRHFGYLESEYGFRRTYGGHPTTSSVVVRYVGQKTYVDISYGPPGFGADLGFSIGRSGVNTTGAMPGFSIGELQRLPGFVKPPESWQTRDRLDGFVKFLAENLRAAGPNLILGKPELFRALQANREVEMNNHALAKKVSNARAVAEVAWNSADYERVIHAYTQYYEHLRPSEQKRLEIAKKRLAKS